MKALTKFKQEYLDLYVQRTKAVPFTSDADLATEEGKREAYRYLLVCGLIPATKVNLKLATKEEFNILFEGLSEKTKTKIRTAVALAQNKWQYDENVSIDDEKDLGWKVESVWIKNGEATSAKIKKTVIAEVTDSYFVDLEEE